MKTTAEDIGNFLESIAKNGQTVYYRDLTTRFSDLPALTGIWQSHPLCQMFGDLDREDHLGSRPFRTALVVTVEKNRPGNGFFEAVSTLRLGYEPIPASKREKLWSEECRAVF